MNAPPSKYSSPSPPTLDAAARKTNDEVFEALGTSPAGLTEPEAAARLQHFGPNEVAQERKHEWLHRLWVAVRNPLVILLTILATVSYATGDLRAGTVMLLMVVLGVTLRFVQETKANTAAAKLKAMIKVTASVLVCQRLGQWTPYPNNRETIMENKGFISTLFDLSFSEFVTTRLIKVLFIIGIVGAGLWDLVFVVGAFKVGFLRGLLMLLLSPIFFLISVLLARIWCELIIVIFRIAENTSRLVEREKS